MKFKLIVDKTKEEEVTATVHARSALTDKLEVLVMQHTGVDQLPAYLDDEMRILPISQIQCITILDGKTYAIDSKAKQYRLKQRLWELEEILPACFLRINKSALANETYLERFTASYNGAVNAVFQCGYTEYVSRRCFAAIKRRYDNK